MSDKTRGFLLSMLVVCLTIVFALVAFPGRVLEADAPKKSAADLEKEKALKNPYPNDLGPSNIDGIIKKYPASHQEGYKLLMAKCSKCHAASRPLHSRFVEAPGKNDQERQAALVKWKKEHPEMFQEKAVWQPEAGIWNRYVKRMMAKPGCDVGKDGKKIWEFLVYDSLERKTGANSKNWLEHRKKLVEEFKTKYPERYKELSEQNDL